MGSHGHQQQFDTTIAYKLAGLIIASLIVVFVLQRMGFRFVTAGNISVSAAP